MSPRKKVQPVCVEAPDVKMRSRIDLLSFLEQTGAVPSDTLKSVSGASEEQIKDFVSAGFKANVLQLSTDNKLQFRTAPLKLLGVAFCEDTCILRAINPKGSVLREERIKILPLKSYKGTKTDTNKIAGSIRQGTKMGKMGFASCGLVIPKPEEKWRGETVDLLAFSLQKVFKCPVYFTREAVACGYAQKAAEEMDLGQSVLYVHSDTGDSVVFKKGLIYESTVYRDEMRSYLGGWKQFGLVETARELIDRGVGTDIIGMIGGDLEKLDIKTIFRAARGGDELAMDLVERSALALGVRIAYLGNIFEIDSVLLPGELSADGGLFTRHLKESSRKFFVDERAEVLEIVPGTLDRDCTATGAALLCRRQLISEV